MGTRKEWSDLPVRDRVVFIGFMTLMAGLVLVLAWIWHFFGFWAVAICLGVILLVFGSGLIAGSN